MPTFDPIADIPGGAFSGQMRGLVLRNRQTPKDAVREFIVLNREVHWSTI